MGNSAVLSHLEGTQKMVAVVINCPHGHPHSVSGAAILASGLKGFLLSGVCSSFEGEMFSGGCETGLVFSTNACFYGINSVFGGVRFQRVELKIISRRVVLRAALCWDSCRSLKILLFGVFSDPLIQNLLGWSLCISCL